MFKITKYFHYEAVSRLLGIGSVTKRFCSLFMSIICPSKKIKVKKFEDYTTSDMKWKYEYPFQNINQMNKPSQRYWTQIDKKNQTS